jgi:hypothetical protein
LDIIQNVITPKEKEEEEKSETFTCLGPRITQAKPTTGNHNNREHTIRDLVRATKGLGVMVACAPQKHPWILARDGHEALLQICFKKTRAIQ